MAQVVYAEPGDELAALHLKLEAAEHAEVVLLVPRRTPFLREPLHWNLVQRRLRALGKVAVVVTQDREVRHSARRAGFAVYRSLRRFKFATTTEKPASSLRPFLKTHRGGGILVALAIVVLGGLLLLGVTSYVVAPSGLVVVKPAAEELTLTMSLKATIQAKGVDVVKSELPARLIQASLEGAETMDTTGRRTDPARARGEVTLLNRTASPLTVPASTTVASGQGAEFLTQEQVILAPSGGTARTQIVAVQTGPSGNIPIMAIDRVTREPFVSALAVWNELPTYGGASDEVGIVSAQDQSNVRSRLLGRLTKEGHDRVQAQRTASESVYPTTIALSPFEEAFDKQPGTEASSLTLRMRGSAKGLAFDGEDVNLLARKSLETRTPPGLSLMTNTLKVAPLEAFDWGEDWVAFRINARAMASALIESDRLLSGLNGKTAREAEALLLQKFPAKGQLSLSVQPLPLDWVPVYSWKLEVRY